MLSSRPGAIYQQDMLNLPTIKETSYHGLRSPDLSPIEHVLGRQLQPSRRYRRINCADAKTMAGSSTGS
ncbi:hypothetical protein TNCV_1955461 [Trichonephila clavipes]|nr:hypothetical protein TNCV_1955461 [Trichonephila clavipes]